MKTLRLDDRLFGLLSERAERVDAFPDQLGAAIIRWYFEEMGAPDVEIQPSDEEDLIARPAPRQQRSGNPSDAE